MNDFKKRIVSIVLSIIMMFTLILTSCDKTEAPESESSSTTEIVSSSFEEISSEESSKEESFSEENSSEESSKEESSSEEFSSEESSSEESSEEESSSEEIPVEIPDGTELENEVKELLTSKHKLTFNADGSFRVLILADVHMNSGSDSVKVQAIKDRIKFLVDKENPNLVIFTGDNTINSSSETKLRENISAMVSYIEEKKIPWCHVYGNHDHEGALSKMQQQSIYESFDYCISKEGPDISGVGNYVHAVYNKDGSVGAVIYCIDSGTYASGGGYDYIKDDQIAWYEYVSKALQKYNGGKVIPAIMAFHIPLIENNEAHKNRDDKNIVYEYTGELNEAICSSATDTELLETIFERGDVKAIVTGHDHKNDYMYNYKGVKLCSSPNFSDLTYTDSAVQGARVLDLNLTTIENVKTHVSYIIERLNPDDFESLGNDVSLEFTEESIKNAIITDWNGGALKGNVSLEMVDDKGINGSSAVQITRDSTDNFELSFALTRKGKLGDNKYLIVWADFSNVEFRKACFGLLTEDGSSAPFRTDDADYKTPFYYLAEGSSEWQTLSHGKDGCFGVGDSGSQGMEGKKGYFAFPVEYFRQGSKALTSDSLVAGFYFYASLNSGADYNVPFYFDDIKLVQDYTTFLEN